MARKVNYITNIRIVELNGKFQPQIYHFVKVKFFQRVKKGWEVLLYDNKYWYDTIEEAENIIDRLNNKIDDSNKIIYYYG